MTHADVTTTGSSAGSKGGKIESRFRGFEFSNFFEPGSAPADPDLAGVLADRDVEGDLEPELAGDLTGVLAGRDVEGDLPLTEPELAGVFADRYW